MKKSLEDYKVDGSYVDEDVCHHEDAESLIQTGILGLCGCGTPDDNLKYVLGGLRLIKELRECSDWNTWNEKCIKHFGSSESAYFFWYWCAKEELSEHGSSVPGWLDEKGESLLAILDEWEKLV